MPRGLILAVHPGDAWKCGIAEKENAKSSTPACPAYRGGGPANHRRNRAGNGADEVAQTVAFSAAIREQIAEASEHAEQAGRNHR